MSLWCIAGFGGTVNVVDKGNTRIWYLQSDPVFEMAAGPLVIVENEPYCSGKGHPFQVSLDRPSPGPGTGSSNYQTKRVRLSTDGCLLEFQWPRAGNADRSYEQTMLYRILVGTSEDSMTMLGEALNIQPSWSDSGINWVQPEDVK